MRVMEKKQWAGVFSTISALDEWKRGGEEVRQLFLEI